MQLTDLRENGINSGKSKLPLLRIEDSSFLNTPSTPHTSYRPPLLNFLMVKKIFSLLLTFNFILSTFN